MCVGWVSRVCVSSSKVICEDEKWKLAHENIDLKCDLDSLISFINLAQRTGQWDTKRYQLKTISLDRVIAVNHEGNPTSSASLCQEIADRDERIDVLQVEIETLKKVTPYQLRTKVQE